MAKVDELRKDAEEAVGSARQAKTEKAKAIRLDIASIWIAAAEPVVVKELPPPRKAG